MTAAKPNIAQRGLLSPTRARIILDDCRQVRYHTVGGYYRVLSKYRSETIIHRHTAIHRQYAPSIYSLRCNHYWLLWYTILY